MRISASTVNAYEQCPRRFWLGYVKGLATVDTPPGVDDHRLHRSYNALVDAPPFAAAYRRMLDLYGDAPAFTFDPIDLVALRIAPATIRGTHVHAACERWHRGGSIDPVNSPIDSIAFELLMYGPGRGMGEIEREFVLEVDGVRWQGRKDLDLSTMTIDWKTTKDYARYGKVGRCSRCDPSPNDPACAFCEGEPGPCACNDEGDDRTCLRCDDLQANLYALEAMIRHGQTSRKMRWVFAETKIDLRGAKTIARAVETTIFRDAALKRVRKANVSARAALALAHVEQLDDVPPDARSCETFGGCPYRTICNLTPEQKFEAQMAIPTLPTLPTTPAAPTLPEGWSPANVPGWYYSRDGKFRNGLGVEHAAGVEAAAYNDLAFRAALGLVPAAPTAPALPVLPEPPAPTAAPVVDPADPMAHFRAAPPVASVASVASAAPPVTVTAEAPKRGPGRPRKSASEGAPAASEGAPAAPAAVGPALAAHVPPFSPHANSTRLALASRNLSQAFAAFAEALEQAEIEAS